MAKNNKAGKFAKKKNTPVLLWLLPILVIALILLWVVLPGQEQTPESTGAGETTVPAETTVPTGVSGETEPADPQESTQATEPTRPSGNYEMPQAYLDVLDRYIRAVAEKWEFIQCEENQISYMLIFDYDLSRLGFHTPDLDSDGVRELIISDGNVIYDLYTLKDDELVWLLSGGERNAYQLCLGGIITNRGSNGAASFVENFYYLKNGELVLKEGILFDGMSEASKWTLTGESLENPETISEQRYQQIVDSYQRVNIPLQPISDTP